MKLHLKVFFALVVLTGMLFPAFSANGEMYLAQVFNMPVERISIRMEPAVEKENKAGANGLDTLIGRQLKIGRAFSSSA